MGGDEAVTETAVEITFNPVTSSLEIDVGNDRTVEIFLPGARPVFSVSAGPREGQRGWIGVERNGKVEVAIHDDPPF